MHDEDEDGYEYEVASGDNIYFPEASNLQTQGARCTKNPGHEKFIPVTEFGPSHLPPECRDDEDFLKLIQFQADFTVKITTEIVSHARPLRFPGGHKRGRTYPQAGTGWCVSVSRCGDTGEDHDSAQSNKSVFSSLKNFFSSNAPKNKSGPLCPCPICRRSDHPKSSWLSVVVCTAAHVVCDDVEAASAEVVFFYDDINSETLTIPCLRVDKRVTSIEDDICLLVCVIHDDISSSRKLYTLWKSFLDYKTSLTAQQKFSLRGYLDKLPELNVITSHPHGSTKHVSVGKIIRFNTITGRYEYQTPTCPGCSGSPVEWISSSEYRYLFCKPHSFGNRKGFGKSGGYVTDW